MVLPNMSREIDEGELITDCFDKPEMMRALLFLHCFLVWRLLYLCGKTCVHFLP